MYHANVSPFPAGRGRHVMVDVTSDMILDLLKSLADERESKRIAYIRMCEDAERQFNELVSDPGFIEFQKSRQQQQQTCDVIAKLGRHRLDSRCRRKRGTR